MGVSIGVWVLFKPGDCSQGRQRKSQKTAWLEAPGARGHWEPQRHEGQPRRDRILEADERREGVSSAVRSAEVELGKN